jgi:dihydroorotase
MVNEGMASTKTGIKADPAISEVIEIERDLRLQEYTGGNLHLTGVSTAEGVRLIKEAKKKGQSVTADVHSTHLIFNEDDVLGFDTNYKVMPPLRFEEDRKALWAGILDGTLDCIVTDHRPHDKEEKDIEFDNAEFGIINLQTSFGSLQSANEFDLNSVIKAIADNPRRMLSLDSNIEVGQNADLTIFSPSKSWKFTKGDILSMTENSPFVDKELKGFVIGVINNGKLVIKEEG